MTDTTRFGAAQAALVDARCELRRLAHESLEDSDTRAQADAAAREITKLIDRLDTACSVDFAGTKEEAAHGGV